MGATLLSGAVFTTANAEQGDMKTGIVVKGGNNMSFTGDKKEHKVPFAFNTTVNPGAFFTYFVMDNVGVKTTANYGLDMFNLKKVKDGTKDEMVTRHGAGLTVTGQYYMMEDTANSVVLEGGVGASYAFKFDRKAGSTEVKDDKLKPFNAHGLVKVLYSWEMLEVGLSLLHEFMPIGKEGFRRAAAELELGFDILNVLD